MGTPNIVFFGSGAAAEGAGCGAGAAGTCDASSPSIVFIGSGVAAASTRVPQVLQKRSPASTAAPHFGQS